MHLALSSPSLRRKRHESAMSSVMGSSLLSKWLIPTLPWVRLSSIGHINFLGGYPMEPGQATAHDDVHGAVHGAFMALPPYTRIREGEVHELSRGVSNGSHRARARPLSET